jgi:hypothetical protein
LRLCQIAGEKETNGDKQERQRAHKYLRADAYFARKQENSPATKGRRTRILRLSASLPPIASRF